MNIAPSTPDGESGGPRRPSRLELTGTLNAQVKAAGEKDERAEPKQLFPGQVGEHPHAHRGPKNRDERPSRYDEWGVYRLHATLP